MRRRVRILPVTPFARMGMSLAVVGGILFLMWSVLGPLGAWPGIVLLALGGASSLVAILRHGERSVVSFALVLPLLFVVGFVLADLLIGHA